MKPEVDDYPTCAGAYATLRIYHKEAGAESVTSALGIAPTETQKIGDTYESSGRLRAKKLNGWFLSSENAVSSFDASRHLSYLLDRLEGKAPALRTLTEEGWRADISCMWDSAYGRARRPHARAGTSQTLGRLGAGTLVRRLFPRCLRIARSRKNRIWRQITAG